VAICQGVCGQDSSVGWGLDGAWKPIPTLKFCGCVSHGGISDPEWGQGGLFLPTAVVMGRLPRRGMRDQGEVL
jgi:hypothetical protein